MREPFIGAKYEKDLHDFMTGKVLGVVLGVVVAIERASALPDRAVMNVGGRHYRVPIDDSWQWRAVENFVQI